MLKKRLGTESIERDWEYDCINDYYKIPTSLIIPKGVESIGAWTFCDCWDLKKVVILGSVKSIGCDAFINCKSLKEVIIPESVKIIGDAAFYGCNNAEIIVEKPASEFEFLGNYAFIGCKIYVKEKTRT